MDQNPLDVKPQSSSVVPRVVPDLRGLISSVKPGLPAVIFAAAPKEERHIIAQDGSVPETEAEMESYVKLSVLPEELRTLIRESLGMLQKNPTGRKYVQDPWNTLSKLGLLFEINRQILHPFGMALEITRAANGRAWFSGLWDCTDDPEGISYDDDTLAAGTARLVAFLAGVAEAKLAEREKRLGYRVQPLPEAPPPEEPEEPAAP